MKPIISILIFIEFLTLPGFAQTDHWRVISDAITRKGIPYATIKVVNKPDGTYANESGRFELKILAKDTLLVTCVGYQSKTVVPQQDTIFLDPVVVNLGEVKVRSKKPKEYAVGLADSRKHGTFYFCGNLHLEISVLIRIPDSIYYYRIKGVKFNSRHENSISLLRLHLYSQGKDEMPFQELLPEDVIINKYLKSNGRIDLSRFNLVSNNRTLFVGLENIESNTKLSLEKGECIGIGFTTKEKQNLTYQRTLRDPKFLWRSSFYDMPRYGCSLNLMVSLILD